ncbi:MAG: OmpH family outer membrane protein [Cyclobacteriaceae bacterium]
MKNLSIIINVILALAVAILYYLHFSSQPSEPTNSVSDGEPSNLQIAFVNADSILANYDYFKVTREALQEKGRKMDSDFRNRAEALQRDINSYQNNANNLTIGQAQAVEADLTKKQQNLRVYQERLAQELTIEESKVNQELYDRVTQYLKKYGDERGIQFVLKFDQSSDLLYAGESLDITKEVIAGLNEDYKTAKSTPADSVKSK